MYVYLYIKYFINLSCRLESSQENRIIVIISEYVIAGILVGFLPLVIPIPIARRTDGQ